MPRPKSAGRTSALPLQSGAPSRRRKRAGGPIFLHAAPCDRYDASELPGWFDFMDPAIVRGYSQDDWIRYDTGEVVHGPELTAACRRILADKTVAYVHIRSKFNCFQCRVERG